MHRQILKLFITVLVLLLAVSACNMPGSSPTSELAQIVAQTQTALARGANTLFTPVAQTPIPGTPGTKMPGTIATAQPSGAVTPGVAATSSPGKPQQSAQPANCTDKARFINETIPDGTQMPPNTPFIKTWTLQNVGTCTWSTEYSLVFVNGEQMGGTSPQPIGQSVPPNSTLQIFLPQTSPAENGMHQGFWMLKNPRGQAFGLGDDASKNFWVKINVTPGAVAPTSPGGVQPTSAVTPVNTSALGPPTRTWTFDDGKAPFYLGDDADIGFDIKNGALVLTAFKPSGDQWRVAEQSFIDNFALEARFTTGPACSGTDDYGLLVRAPQQPNGIIDTGYVFGFNCDGQFRVYRMDAGNFTALVHWTNHPSVKSGPNQANVMTVVGNGAHMQLYANSTLVFEFDDASYPNGLFGMLIGSGGTQNFEVSVDQLSLWDLP